MGNPSWIEIYGYFISFEKTSLRDCATEFAISYDSLRQKAASEKWYEKKKKLYLNALNEIEGRIAEEIKIRTEEQIKQAQLLQQKGLTAILELGVRPKTFEEARKAIEVGIELERVALGMK